MRYVIRTFIAMALFAFCWVTMGYGIFQMLSVGTCASGGPYEVARECPDGIEAVVFALVGGTFGLFIAAGIYLSRGNPPGGAPPPDNGGIVVWFWTGLFWALAAGCFLGVWGPEANPGPGGELGGLIVGFMGLLFGAGGLLALKLGDTGKPKRRQVVAPAVAKLATAATPFTPPGDPVDRLEKLDRLRRQGALTDAEFETLKAKLIGER